jgi:hypothetical protein
LPAFDLVSTTIKEVPCRQPGLIKYNRDHMQILDREKLEESACACYAVVSKQYKRLFDVPRCWCPPGTFVSHGNTAKKFTGWPGAIRHDGTGNRRID